MGRCAPLVGRHVLSRLVRGGVGGIRGEMGQACFKALSMLFKTQVRVFGVSDEEGEVNGGIGVGAGAGSNGRPKGKRGGGNLFGLSAKQLRALLVVLQMAVAETEHQNASFALIRAVVVQKVMLPEVRTYSMSNVCSAIPFLCSHGTSWYFFVKRSAAWGALGGYASQQFSTYSNVRVPPRDRLRTMSVFYIQFVVLVVYIYVWVYVCRYSVFQHRHAQQYNIKSTSAMDASLLCEVRVSTCCVLLRWGPKHSFGTLPSAYDIRNGLPVRLLGSLLHFYSNSSTAFCPSFDFGSVTPL